MLRFGRVGSAKRSRCQWGMRQGCQSLGRQIWVGILLPLTFPIHLFTSLTVNPPLRHCIYTLPGHTSTIRCMRVLHGRPIAVTGSRDGTVRVWDVQRGRAVRCLRRHQGSVRCLDVNGKRAVSGSYDMTCRVGVFPFYSLSVGC